MRVDVPTGTVLAGFRVESLIGEGAMGEVYLKSPEAVALADQGGIDYMPPDWDNNSLLIPGGVLERKTLVIGNSVNAKGTGGVVQAGGVWNSTFSEGDPQPQLTLTDSAVTRDTLRASAGLGVQGGGLFTTAPVTLTRTVIAGNHPDQCFGC
jgi:hypothetical protein